MKSNVSVRSTSTFAALALFGASVVPAVAGERVAQPRVRQQQEKQQREVTREVVVVKQSSDGTDDAAPHSIVVSTRHIDGEPGQTEVQVLGDDHQFETFTLDELEKGDSQTFKTRDGRTLDVTRNDAGIVLSLDGKSIDLPQLAGLPRVPGVPGEPGAMAFSFKTGGSFEDENVIVATGGPHVFVRSLSLSDEDFENLESLKGLDPDVREKVVAALQEILASPKVMALAHGDTDASGETSPHVIVRKVRTAE